MVWRSLDKSNEPEPNRSRRFASAVALKKNKSNKLYVISLLGINFVCFYSCLLVLLLMMNTICVRNIQLKYFISVHCQLKGSIPILNCFTFVMERQCGLRSYLDQTFILVFIQKTAGGYFDGNICLYLVFLLGVIFFSTYYMTLFLLVLGFSTYLYFSLNFFLEIL